MKKVTTEGKEEFLYPADVWSGFLGKNYKDKIEKFFKKGFAESSYKDMKIIHRSLHAFLEWRPDGSPIAYESIYKGVTHNKKPHLSVVAGFPFLAGKKQKMEITCIRGNDEHNRIEGYIGLSFTPGAQDMMAYNPLFALQRQVFYHMKANKKGKFKANVCVAGLALSIRKSPRKIIKIDKGAFYETMLKKFLEKNPDKTKEDYPYTKIDASHMSAFLGKEIKDEYEYASDIYSVKKFKFNNIDFYRLELQVHCDIETGKSMKIYLYVNKELLGKYEPKVKDNIHGFMQLTAYLDDKECSKIMEESKEAAEIITTKDRISYKLEVPKDEDEFSNGLAFRNNLPAQTGMLYLYKGGYASMYTAQTKIPVDYIFTDLCGNILKIARDVKPLSYEVHQCKNTTGVLEINKGEADKFGIKEGDILLNKHLYPNYDYGKLTVKEADKYFRYDIDLYAEKGSLLYFYSYKSHAWYAADDDYRRKLTNDLIKNCITMGIERVELTESETEKLMNEYENELRSDYAKTLKRYYRMSEKLFYLHDEINDTFQLYTFKNGWVNVDWLRSAYEVLNPLRNLALRSTSTRVELLIDKYKNIVKNNDFKEDESNLLYMHYDEGKECKDKFSSSFR